MTALVADQASTLNANNVAISVAAGGGNIVGVQAAGGSNVTLNGGSVSVSGGSGSTGLLAQGAGTVLTASGTPITLNAAQSAAGTVQNGWQPYGRVNLWHDWDGRATTLFGVDQVPLIEEATRLEFAGGITARLKLHLSLYAQAGYQFAIGDSGGGRRQGVLGDLGVRYTW